MSLPPEEWEIYALASSAQEGAQQMSIRPNSQTTNTNGIRIDWQSTPRLWMATRESYCGAPDSKRRSEYGLGKTPAEALAHLLEQELDREPA